VFRINKANKSQGPAYYTSGIVNCSAVVMFVTGICQMSSANTSDHRSQGRHAVICGTAVPGIVFGAVGGGASVLGNY